MTVKGAHYIGFDLKVTSYDDDLNSDAITQVVYEALEQAGYIKEFRDDVDIDVMEHFKGDCDDPNCGNPGYHDRPYPSDEFRPYPSDE